MVALVAAALSAAHGYMAWRGARIAEAAAVDNLAVESKAGVQWIREIMHLPPGRLDCAADEIAIVLADMGCGTGGSIQVRLGEQNEALFEAEEASVYRVSGTSHRRHLLSRSEAQQQRLGQMVSRWPKSVPAGRQDCLRIPSFPEAMMVCDGGRHYGIDEGDKCGSGVRSPAGELLDVLEASLERAPHAGPILCI